MALPREEEKPLYTCTQTTSSHENYGEESAEAGSTGVIVYGYDGLRMQPVATPSLDYVPGPDHLPSPDYVPEHPLSPVYVLEREYPEYLVPLEDDEPIEDQPLSTDASLAALSPGYMANSDPEEDPEEDSEEDHTDYPANGGDSDDEPSDDDTDEEDEEDQDDDKEEEEHLALTDSSAVPNFPVPPGGDIEALETDESVPTPRPPQTIIPFSQTRLRRIQGRGGSTAGAARQPGPTLESDRRRAPTTLEGVNQRVIDLATIVKQDTDEFYVRFKDPQDDRALLRARVNTLFRDRLDNHRTAMLLDREAMLNSPFSCVTWLSMCTLDRPIGKEGCASWDRARAHGEVGRRVLVLFCWERAQRHMGRSGECLGNVQMNC
nr:hypothetical protein [Tanacetum cinerariifolium]